MWKIKIISQKKVQKKNNCFLLEKILEIFRIRPQINGFHLSFSALFLSRLHLSSKLQTERNSEKKSPAPIHFFFVFSAAEFCASMCSIILLHTHYDDLNQLDTFMWLFFLVLEIFFRKKNSEKKLCFFWLKFFLTQNFWIFNFQTRKLKYCRF